MERRHAILALLALLLLVSNPTVGRAEQPSHGLVSEQDAAAALNQVKEIASRVWEVVSPWVQWAKAAGRDVLAIVYEKASFQGLKSVATEASSISFNFFAGKPYQAAYQVAKDVPVAGSALKDVIGEAKLRKQAAREQVEEEKEL